MSDWTPARISALAEHLCPTDNDKAASPLFGHRYMRFQDVDMFFYIGPTDPALVWAAFEPLVRQRLYDDDDFGNALFHAYSDILNEPFLAPLHVLCADYTERLEALERAMETAHE